MNNKKVRGLVYWLPRGLAIVFIIFLSLFSLDVFDESLNFWRTGLALFMHNIPSLVLLAVLIISWKREIVGGIGFILAGLLYIIFAFHRADNWMLALMWSLQIAGIALVIGGLFLFGWIRKRH